MSILFATNAFPARGEAQVRNAAALESLRRLEHVRLVNVQPAAGAFEVAGIKTLPALLRDAVTVSGVAGPARPIVVDIFDAAARAALAGSERYFAFANSDIEVSQSAIDFVLAHDHEAYIFSRLDYDGASHAPVEYVTAGCDMFVLDAHWWVANRFRFRDYILGDRSWDNVFTSIILCHADGVLLNREPYILHQRHGSNHAASPFGAYTQYLSALDRLYFTLWAEYHWQLEPLRARNAPAAAEVELCERTFRFKPSLRARALQLGRAIKAYARYGAAQKLERNQLGEH